MAKTLSLQRAELYYHQLARRPIHITQQSILKITLNIVTPSKAKTEQKYLQTQISSFQPTTTSNYITSFYSNKLLKQLIDSIKLENCQ